VIDRNLKKAKLEARTRQQDVFEFVRRAESLGRFDAIFADPPYQQMQSGEFFTDKLLNSQSLANLLASDGLFILEKRPEDGIPESPFWQVVRRKTYGATEVLFLARSSTWHRLPADGTSAGDSNSQSTP
jgi:16S rRNA G966 N2-methylase RsmD